jgi:hypothetical protein
MRIVQQLAAVFYSPFPALPAPQIAGLLPATVPSRIDSHQLVIDFVPPVSDNEFGRFRTKEEMDAELEPLVFAAYESMARLYEFRAQRSRRQ